MNEESKRPAIKQEPEYSASDTRPETIAELNTQLKTFFEENKRIREFVIQSRILLSFTGSTGIQHILHYVRKNFIPSFIEAQNIRLSPEALGLFNQGMLNTFAHIFKKSDFSGRTVLTVHGQIIDLLRNDVSIIYLRVFLKHHQKNLLELASHPELALFRHCPKGRAKLDKYFAIFHRYANKVGKRLLWASPDILTAIMVAFLVAFSLHEGGFINKLMAVIIFSSFFILLVAVSDSRGDKAALSQNLAEGSRTDECFNTFYRIASITPLQDRVTPDASSSSNAVGIHIELAPVVSQVPPVTQAAAVPAAAPRPVATATASTTTNPFFTYKYGKEKEKYMPNFFGLYRGEAPDLKESTKQELLQQALQTKYPNTQQYMKITEFQGRQVVYDYSHPGFQSAVDALPAEYRKKIATFVKNTRASDFVPTDEVYGEDKIIRKGKIIAHGGAGNLRPCITREDEEIFEGVGKIQCCRITALLEDHGLTQHDERQLDASSSSQP